MDLIYRKIFLLVLCLILAGCSNSSPTLLHLQPSDVIVAFGDSITYGTGATLETSYPAQLEKLIGLKVINAGVPGEETKDSLIRLPKVLDEYNPRLVIVCLGGNDLLRQRPVADIKANLKKIIQMIKSHGAQVVLIGVPVISYNVHVPELYAELGEEMYIPTDTEMYREFMTHPEYKSDYIHLNSNGYKLFAEKIVDFLKKVGAI